jgi:hypothetical protein
LPVLNPQRADVEMLDDLQRTTFEHFRHEVNLHNDLIADKTQPGSPSSMAAVGLGLGVYLVAVGMPPRVIPFVIRKPMLDISFILSR